ncbi:MAG: GtrA family protein [Actinomycetes bacterium]
MVRPLGQMLAPLRRGMHVLVREVVKFGVVGALAYVVDVGLFNMLRYAGPALLEHKPLTAKAISVVAATLVAWVGNRYWTFRHRRRVAARRELVMFGVTNVVGLAIGLGCLAFSHYVLDLTSPLADNISANVVGLGLGTIFRFLAYRYWVFTEMREEPPQLVAAARPL